MVNVVRLRRILRGLEENDSSEASSPCRRRCSGMTRRCPPGTASPGHSPRGWGTARRKCRSGHRPVGSGKSESEAFHLERKSSFSKLPTNLFFL